MKSKSNEMSSLRRSCFFYGAAFLIPFLIFGVMLFLLKITPFGDNTIAYIDANNQYLSFFAYLKQNLSNPSAFFYNTSINIGGNFFGIFTYYLLNPLNLLILFFPVGRVPNFLLTIVWLKLSISGLAMFIYLHFHFKLSMFKVTEKRNAIWFDLVISTAYSLSAFSIIYMSNVMWLDAIILLPLIMLGLEKIFSGQRPYLFGLLLFYAFVVNYYTGFIISFFCVIEFIFLILWSKVLKQENIITLRNRSVAAIITGGLSLGLASAVLIPSYLSTTGVLKEPYRFSFDFMYNLVDETRGILGGVPGNVPQVGPLIFCGMFVITALVLFFSSSSIRGDEKRLWFYLIVTLISFSVFKGIYLAWHAFAMPNGFPQRESFCLVFVMCQVAAVALRSDLNISGHKLERVLLIVTAFLILLSKVESFISGRTLVYSLAMMAIFGVLITRQNLSRFGGFALVVLAFLDISYGVWMNWGTNQTQLQVSAFNKYVDTLGSSIRDIKRDDSTFYRIGISTAQSTNQPLLLNYNGMSSYTSTQPTNLVNFMAAVGYHQNHGWTRWSNYSNGSTRAMDELFGVKYRIENSNSTLQKDFNRVVASVGYDNVVNNLSFRGKLISNVNNLKIYRDTDALPLAMTVDRSALWGNHQLEQTSNINPFKNQNLIWRSITGDKRNLNDLARIDLMPTTTSAIKKYRVVANHDGELYAEFPQVRSTLISQPLNVFLNGRLISEYRTEGENGIIDLGNFHAGQASTVTLRSSDNKPIEGMNLDARAYTQNSLVLRDGRKLLKASGVIENQQIKNNHIKLKVNNKRSQTLMLSLPYDEAWKITDQNGRILTQQRAVGTLMGIEVSAGTKMIHLVYEPAGLHAGILISAVSSLLIIGCSLFYEYKQRVQ